MIALLLGLALAANEPAATIEPVSFADAVQRAMTNATSSLVAASEVARASALLVEIRSVAMPSLVANGTYTRLDADRVSRGQVMAARDQQGANLTLNVPLVAPSRWSSWAHARDAVDVAVASQADTVRLAALVAGRAYLTVLAQHRLLEVSRAAVDVAQARLAFAQARQRGGVGTTLDELRAQEQLATSNAQIESSYSGLVRAQEALGQSCGGAAPLDAVAEPVFAAPPVSDIELARDKRADLAAAKARHQAARRVERDSWIDWLPSLIATFQPFYQNPATATVPERGWQMLFVLSLPIFEGGSRSGQQAERAALAEEAQTQLDAVARQVNLETRVALQGLTHNEAALSAARDAASRAHQIFDLVSEAYRAGGNTSLEVTEAEQQARDLDITVVIAEDAVRQARLDLLAAVGGFP